MSDLLFGLTLLLLISISALCSGITNGMFALNHYQLKRKAQLGSKDAKIVYPIHALRYQLLVTLLIINIASNATISILLSSKTSGFLAVVFSTVFILIFGEIIPMIYLRKYVVYTTARIAPVLKRVISFMTPISRPVASLLDKWVGSETQIFYSKEELLKMFDGQKLSGNSDIAVDEARMLRTVLEFGDKKIRDVMTPRRIVKVIDQNDGVGPILMDELHKSGHSRFPVVSDTKHNNFVGTLYLRDLVGQGESKTVKDIMTKYVRYIHEEESLDHALRAFIKTHHHLFVVVNSFEEFVGVLTIEDVLEEIIGKEIVDEFDQHDDLRAVAKSLAEKEHKVHKVYDEDEGKDSKITSKMPKK
jgi:CBS domain containing-hemolysin-like protein